MAWQKITWWIGKRLWDWEGRPPYLEENSSFFQSHPVPVTFYKPYLIDDDTLQMQERSHTVSNLTLAWVQYDISVLILADSAGHFNYPVSHFSISGVGVPDLAPRTASVYQGLASILKNLPVADVQPFIKEYLHKKAEREKKQGCIFLFGGSKGCLSLVYMLRLRFFWHINNVYLNFYIK